MKIQIKNRFASAVLYATEVDDSDAYPIRTALSRAYLADADLADANLAGADIAGADLARANLAGADLVGADIARDLERLKDLQKADPAGAQLLWQSLADHVRSAQPMLLVQPPRPLSAELAEDDERATGGSWFVDKWTHHAERHVVTVGAPLPRLVPTEAPKKRNRHVR